MDIIGALVYKKFLLKNKILFFNNIFDYSSQYFMAGGVVSFSSFRKLFLVGVNLRLDAPLIFTRLQRQCLRGELLVYSFGFNYASFGFFNNLGVAISLFLKFLEGRHFWSAVAPDFFLLGAPLAFRVDSFLPLISNILSLIRVPFFRLSRSLGELSSFEIALGHKLIGGELWRSFSEKQFSLFSLGDDALHVNASELSVTFNLSSHLKNFFVRESRWQTLNARFCQTLSSSSSAMVAPLSFITEQMNFFVNLEGRFLRSSFVETPIGDVRTDWSFFLSLDYFLTLFSSDLGLVLVNDLNFYIQRVGLLLGEFFRVRSFFEPIVLLSLVFVVHNGFLSTLTEVLFDDLFLSKSSNMLLSLQRTVSAVSSNF